jgi:hypothetical protein
MCLASDVPGMLGSASSRVVRPALLPGDMALITGIYRVTHKGHRPDHYVAIIRGEEFPVCRTCRGAVRFTLQTQADHVTADFDFAGPSLRLVKK